MARKQLPGGTSRDLFGNAHGTGKGDKPRHKLTDEYRRNHEAAFGPRKRLKEKYVKRY